MANDGGGAYAKNTVRAQKADGAIFQAFCEGRGLAYFPAEPTTIRAFVEHCVEQQKKPATIRRYVATISRALLCIAYDTMARRSEFLAFDVGDVEFMPNGSGTLLIRRSKTDAAGEGARTYLSHDTVKWLRQWLESSGIEEGAIFRRLIGQNRVGDRLHADIVADIYKRAARWIGMQAGRWKSSRMPMRYGEEILAARGGMARAASA
jgi:integrase